MQATVVTLGLYRSSGGPSKSIKAFQQALDAAVISWVDPIQVAQEATIWDSATVVHGSRLPLLRQLLVPRAKDLPDAARLVRSSSLLSVHSFFRWHCQWARSASRTYKVPYWFVPHGSLDPYVFETERLVKTLFLRCGGRSFLNDAAAIICATRRELEKVRHVAPHVRGEIVHWPLLPTDFRERDPAARTAVRRSLSIPEDATCFLYFGRLHPMKRPLETIDAFARSESPHSHLLIVGNEFGVTVDDCRARARSLGVGGRVHALGPAYGADRLGYLDAADVYVSLSSRENFNFTAAEAMASGLPIILSPGNDLAADLATAACGWMLNDEADAPQAIHDAARCTPEELRIAGHAGRLWCRHNLAPDAFATRIRVLAAELGRSRS